MKRREPVRKLRNGVTIIGSCETLAESGWNDYYYVYCLLIYTALNSQLSLSLSPFFWNYKIESNIRAYQWSGKFTIYICTFQFFIISCFFYYTFVMSFR